MSKRALFFLTALLLSVSPLFMGDAAYARRPIRWARVIKLVNTVRFKPVGAGWRYARRSDRLQRAGESLFTSRGSRAELRLSEGSLLRMSSNTHLWLNPNSRDLIQRSGTALYVIRPGGGRTTIRTPYGRAGIRGSALFVRVNEQTGAMIVGALTNSPEGPMEIKAVNGEEKALEAGQMAVIQGGKVQMYEFDLNTFYQTSSLIKGLGLDGKSAVDTDTALSDPEIQKTLKAVQAETVPALAAQTPIAGRNVAVNPAILRPSSRNLQPRDLVMQSAVGNIQPSTSPGGTLAERQLANSPQALPVTAAPAAPPPIPPIDPPPRPPSTSPTPAVPSPPPTPPLDRAPTPTDQSSGLPGQPTLPPIQPVQPAPQAPSLAPPVETPVQPPPVEPPASTPPTEPPAAMPPTEPPAATPPTEPPAAMPPTEPPAATPPTEPPAATPPAGGREPTSTPTQQPNPQQPNPNPDLSSVSDGQGS